MIGYAVAFADVAENVADESPVAAAVVEIPAFAALFNVQTDGVGADADGSDHGAGGLLRQRPSSADGSLDFDDEAGEIAGGGPQAGGGLFGIDVPGGSHGFSLSAVGAG